MSAGPSFFGEVRDLTSRAVWYSDSEDEEEKKKTDDDEEEEDISDPSDMVQLPQLDDVTVDGISLDPKTTPDLINITIANFNKPLKLLHELEIVASGTCLGTPNSKPLCTIYKLSNPERLWVRINESHPFVKNQFVVRVMQLLVSKLVDGRKDTSSISILLKECPGERPGYITNNPDIKRFSLPQSVTQRRFLPPFMITNQIEAAIMEYCIMENIACCAVLIPGSTNIPGLDGMMVADTNSKFIDTLENTNIYV